VANPAAASPAQLSAEPRKPDWPVNAQAGKAKVEWNSRGLYIVADNSSLKQILEEVSIATGVKLDGLAEDERVFGSYGPGVAREVLSKLLDGTEYNVLMSGDQGQGTPRAIVLSRRQATSGRSSTAGGPAQAAGRNAAPQDTADDDDAAPEEPAQPAEPSQAEQQQAQQQQQQAAQQQQQQQQTPSRPVFGTPRTPQQVIQDMQQRQQQLQQEQQNNSQ